MRKRLGLQKSWKVTKRRSCLNDGLAMENIITGEIECFCKDKFAGQYCGDFCSHC